MKLVSKRPKIIEFVYLYLFDFEVSEHFFKSQIMIRLILFDVAIQTIVLDKSQPIGISLIKSNSFQNN